MMHYIFQHHGLPALVSLVATAMLIWRWQPGATSLFLKDEPKHHYDFGDFPASEQLIWHPCFEELNFNFQCARLTVPLDSRHQVNPLYESSIQLALVMLPGRNRTRPSQHSPAPLLVNPGGPGASGVSFMWWIGTFLQEIVGYDQDIIGFDPRGVGYSRPRADCWAKSRAPESAKDFWNRFIHRRAWELGTDTMRSITKIAFGHAIGYLDARTRATSRLCEEMHTELGATSIFPHLGNTHTARDMLRIIEAWDDWRVSDKSIVERGPDETLRKKLLYWGFSYGTFIGATFAAMFPDRVGRILLDGVLDTMEAVSPFMVNNTRDADKVLDQFFRYCHDAKDDCYFYRPGDSMLDGKRRYQSIVDSLEESPVGFLDPDEVRPIVFTASDLQAAIFAFLYMGYHGFPTISIILNAAYEKNWGEIIGISRAPNFPAMCEADKYSWVPGFLDNPLDDSNLAISCADRLHLMNASLSEIKSAYLQMSQVSSFGGRWMELTFRCNGWSINSSEPPIWIPSQPTRPINTSFPLLFIGNTFQNAGLIELQGSGHCSYSAVSACALRAIRAYFRQGIVPPPPVVSDLDGQLGDWKLCEADDQPSASNIGFLPQNLDHEDQVMMAAWRNVVKRVDRFHSSQRGVY
ncbi:hypothetical protein S40288_09885 [Stachybotrys chartarum IBT 40288]|nr:hypothetical protein S40288_09885 [Stachybotrys chartarum IBT 40288]